MAILKFKASEVARIVRHALTSPEHRSAYGQEKNPGPQLWLVGDRGIYLMSNGSPVDKRDPDGESEALFVAYAEGCNPDVNEFDVWWENKRDWFGGDDGVDALPWCKAIDEQLLWKPTPEFIRIGISKKGLVLMDPEYQQGARA